MRHRVGARCFSVLLIALSPFAISGQTRIYFTRGATQAAARGYLRGIRDEVNFVLRAKAGQHMRVEINGRGATRGVVIFPSGKQDGGPGGVVFDDNLDEIGDYRIRVTESSMANAWRGSFTVKIDIVSRSGEAGASSADYARYVGKYPNELFRSEPKLKVRLRELLGGAYAAFTNRLQTEMPIERDGDVLIVRGCMAHQCTIEEAILAVDLNDSRPTVAIKSTQYGGGFKVFAEDKDRVPEALRRAMQR